MPELYEGVQRTIRAASSTSKYKWSFDYRNVGYVSADCGRVLRSQELGDGKWQGSSEGLRRQMPNKYQIGDSSVKTSAIR